MRAPGPLDPRPAPRCSSRAPCDSRARARDALVRSSRLATCIKLTKDLDGITVIVPDTNPDLSNYS